MMGKSNLVDAVLKYRIVGAAVLLSLAVIFVPMILDGSGKESITTIDMEMPPKPALVFSGEIDEQLQMPAPQYSSENNVQVETKDTQPAENIMPEVVVSDQIKPELQSWVVQVGAFSEKQKAVAMQKNLLNSGFDALVELGKNKGKEYYRVKVGPVISQDDATKIKNNLQKEFKLETAFVTRYPRKSQ